MLPRESYPPAEPVPVNPVPETPVIPAAPVAVETPVIPEAPIAPVIPEVPVAPEAPVIPEAPVVPEVPVAPEPPSAPAEPASAEPAPATPAASAPTEQNPFGNLVEQTPPIDGLNQPFSAIGVEGKEMPETPVSSNTEIIKHIPKEEVPATPADEDIELPMLNTNDAQNTLNNLSGETFEIK